MSNSIVDFLTEPRYSSGEVVQASGVSRLDLQNWCNRGILQFQDVPAGGRSYRKFSILDAFAVFVANELRQVGINPLDSKGVAALARAGVAQRFLSLKDPDFLGAPTGRFLSIPSKGQPTFVGEEGGDAAKLNAVLATSPIAVVLDLDWLMVKAKTSLPSFEPAGAVEG